MKSIYDHNVQIYPLFMSKRSKIQHIAIKSITDNISPKINVIVNDNIYSIVIDITVKIDNNIIMVIESKAYCDFSMFKRAYSEWELIWHKYNNRKIDNEVEAVLFQAENGMEGDIEKYPVFYPLKNPSISKTVNAHIINKREFTNLSYGNIAFLTLYNRKRKSSSEISKENVKIDDNRFNTILNFFVNSFKKYI